MLVHSQVPHLMNSGLSPHKVSRHGWTQSCNPCRLSRLPCRWCNSNRRSKYIIHVWRCDILRSSVSTVTEGNTGRFLAGMGLGMLAMLAPLYQAEIAHPSIRGRLTTLQQFMMGVRYFYTLLGAVILTLLIGRGSCCFFHWLRMLQWPHRSSSMEDPPRNPAST